MTQGKASEEQACITSPSTIDLASLQFQDGTRRIFSHKAAVACVKREAVSDRRRVVSRTTRQKPLAGGLRYLLRTPAKG